MTARGEIPSSERERLHAAAGGVDAAAGELRAAVQSAWRAGGSVRAIAAELGKSTRTIQNWLEEARREAPSR
ncbi:helix-turn-helix domain-containing protein (plasmid) [Mycobacterium sp. TJFP1]